MTEENTSSEPAVEPKKTLSMKSLKGEMDERNEAVDERLDQMEGTIGDTAANVESILEMMKGMSALNRPTHAPTGGRDAEEIAADYTAKDGVLYREVTGEDGVSEIETTDMSLEQIGHGKLEALAFDQEMVTIELAPIMDEEQDPRVEVAVNGRSVILQRGAQATIPRMFVEGLARARPYSYGNIEYTKPDGSRSVKWPIHVGLRYPFHVVQDNNPRGTVWLESLLSQRH